MKKALIVLLLLAVAGGLFAQTFTLNGRVDAWWTPFQSVHKDQIGGVIIPGGENLFGAAVGREGNGANGTRARLFFVGESKDKDFGINVQLQFYPQSDSQYGSTRVLDVDDNVNGWWQPHQIFRLTIGKFVEASLRGKIGYFPFRHLTTWSWNEDQIFTQFRSQGDGGYANTGVLMKVDVAGFIFGASFPGLYNFNSYNDHMANGTVEAVNFGTGRNELVRAYQRSQIAAGYKFSMGLARVQYIGNNPIWPSTAGFTGTTITTLTGVDLTGGVTPRIEAAFAFTAVSGLVLDLGVKYNFPLKQNQADTAWNQAGSPYEWDVPSGAKSSDAKIQKPHEISLGGQYDIAALRIIGRVDGKFAGTYKPNGTSDKLNYPSTINVHIWPSYDVGFMRVGLDAGFEFEGKTTYAGTVINAGTSTEWKGGIRAGAGAWVEKAWGASFIRGGIAYRAGTKINGYLEDAVLSIPVMIDFRF